MLSAQMQTSIQAFKNSLYAESVVDMFDNSGLLLSTIATMDIFQTSDLENATRYDTMLLQFDDVIAEMQEYLADMQKSRELLAKVACQWEDDIIAEYGKEEWNKWTR